jgi:hypothetical protein
MQRPGAIEGIRLGAIGFWLCALTAWPLAAQDSVPAPHAPREKRLTLPFLPQHSQNSAQPQHIPAAQVESDADWESQLWQDEGWEAAPAEVDWTLGCSPCRDSRYNRSVILGRLWSNFEILGWATKGSDVPALVTTSPINPLTPEDEAGVLGLATTDILFGGTSVHDELQPGGRLTIGWNWCQGEPGGFEGYYFGMDGRRETFEAVAVDGEGILARPIVNDATGLPDSILTAYPNLLDGAIAVEMKMHFSGAGILLRRPICGDCCQRVDLIGGYRHVRLTDSVQIGETLLALDDVDGFVAGDLIGRFDTFRSVNHFHGAELGIESRMLRGNFVVVGLAKGAIGASHKSLTIAGQTLIDDGVAVTAFEGGVLALPSNIGRYSTQDFGAMGEIGVSMEWQPWNQMRLTLGYSWLYWSDVLRAPEQIDTRIDRDQLAPNAAPGARPAVNLQETSFWAHGLTGGIRIDF